MNCGTCKFFVDGGFKLSQSGSQSADPSRNYTAGTCRHDSPRPGANNWRTWPTVLVIDHCHKHEAAAVGPAVAPVVHIMVPDAVPAVPVDIPIVTTAVADVDPARKRGRPRKT